MDELTAGVAALETIPFFAGVEREDLERILRIGRRSTFEPGQAIVERGDLGDGMYIVLRGTARVEVGGRYHDLRAGNFFGEMAVLAGRKRTATVRAQDEVHALKIPSEQFQAFLLRHPGVAVTMLRSLAERLREVQERVDSWAGAW